MPALHDIRCCNSHGRSKVGDGQGMGVNQQYWNINNVQLHVKVSQTLIIQGILFDIEPTPTAMNENEWLC